MQIKIYVISVQWHLFYFSSINVLFIAGKLQELQGGKSYVSKIGKSIFIFGTLQFIHITPFYNHFLWEQYFWYYCLYDLTFDNIFFHPHDDNVDGQH